MYTEPRDFELPPVYCRPIVEKLSEAYTATRDEYYNGICLDIQKAQEQHDLFHTH